MQSRVVKKRLRFMVSLGQGLFRLLRYRRVAQVETANGG